MHHALFLSPHLDDVAFSCAGTLLRLLQLHWKVTLVTIFTATVPEPQGFALACQTSKGITPDVDYMALRRAEDDVFAHTIGLRDWRHWNFAEAPHRGYNSAPELFAGINAGDEAWRPISEQLGEINDELQPDLVFAPQGLGNHVDHLHTILAVKATDNMTTKTFWYRDTPYAIRQPDAAPSPLLPSHLGVHCMPLKEMDLERKILGSWAYTSQVGFQFDGAAQIGTKLRAFHSNEAHGLNGGQLERYAECFLAPPALHLPLSY